MENAYQNTDSNRELNLINEQALEYSVEPEDSSSGSLMDRPFNPKDIDIKSKTMSLDNIIKRLQHGDIDMNTEFQRNMNLWSNDQQSRLIESILISFPLPAFYFDGTDDNRWLVVDGLQRLSAINNFIVDKTDNKLRLSGLEFLDHLTGKCFDDLQRNLQRKIEEAEIVAYIINPGTPPKVKFNIFKRINTGGLILESQEIRHALNQGTPAKFVAELASLEEFTAATEHVISPKRMLDREFVTRFMAFYINKHQDYKPDLDTFLNESMRQISNMTAREREVAREDFKESMVLCREIFQQWAFRKVFNLSDRRKPINKALFEVWSVVLARLSRHQREIIRNKGEVVFKSFINLMNDDEYFVASISSSTGDKSRVSYRIERIESLISNQL